ncbi:hypothetical protein CL629_00935 [bacterium]|nr:hypothetical protein [bacterium]|tara:strand:+ start:1811 stop:3268 length:1458 start_codon:yes stop_codon:yes gene_type:complete
MKLNVPKETEIIARTLSKKGFQAYLVGGCVRDLVLDKDPKDWDIATDATPEQIQELFEDSVYENEFGTVGVKTDSEDPALKVLEVTTFRKEGGYSDKRHPDEVKFAKTIEEDLTRRDFTINAMALDLVKAGELVDPHKGQDDLDSKLVRTVGRPDERFGEDALRLMRAVRFAVELEFEVEENTAGAVAKLSDSLKDIAMERAQDELKKIIMSDGAARGVQMLEDLGLLKHIIPELREGIGCEQNLHHIYTVWEHNLRALDYAVSKGYSLEIRLAAMLHDVGKPKTKRGEGKNSTFYGHEVVGARITKSIMNRLRFSGDVADNVVHLVRYHLFYYNVGEVSEAGVRRFLARVGPENIDDLIKIREADRIGSGVPKAKPYKIRHLLFMIDKVKRDPISPKMLKVSGDDIIKILGTAPGPRVGWILSALMDEVLEEPKKNTKKGLGIRIEELGKMSDEELQELGKQGKEKIDEAEKGVEGDIKKKHGV